MTRYLSIPVECIRCGELELIHHSCLFCGREFCEHCGSAEECLTCECCYCAERAREEATSVEVSA